MNQQRGHTFILHGGYVPLALNPRQGTASPFNGLPQSGSVISADHNDQPYISFVSNVEIYPRKHVFRGNGIATLMVYGRGQVTMYRCGTDFAALNPNAVFPLLRNGTTVIPGEAGTLLGENPYGGVGSQIGEIIVEWNYDANGDLAINNFPNIPNPLYPVLYPEHVPGPNPFINTFFKLNRWTRIWTAP
jgi:hypothetical protein